MNHSSITSKTGVKGTGLHSIKNIIFDLGGVILDIHYQSTVDAFVSLHFKDFILVMKQMRESKLFDQFESGQIPSQAFRNELRKFKSQLQDEEIDRAWNAMIGELPKENIELLQRLATKYRIFLLSNTNSIHINFLQAKLKQTFGEDFFQSLFERIFYSFEIGLVKPDIEVYQYVIERAGLKPNETLFVDDLLINVEGARKAGLWAYHLQDEPLTNLFE